MSEFHASLPLRSALQDKYAAFYATLRHNESVPLRILELCRHRIAAIHDCEAEWSIADPEVPLTATEKDRLRRGEFSEFTVAERAALAVAEKISFQHHQITDTEVERIRADLGEAGCVALLTALSFFDANCRLRIVTTRLFD